MRATKTEYRPIDKDFLLNEVIHELNNMGFEITPRQLRHWEKMELYELPKDSSGYRRLSYEDIQRIIFIAGLRMLGISLPRIKDMLIFMAPKEKLLEMLKKDPSTFISKQRDAQGKVEWYPRPELHDKLKNIDNSLKRTKDGLKKFEELVAQAEVNFFQAVLKYRTQVKVKK